jgi:plasmid stabilization system protein ParE
MPSARAGLLEIGQYIALDNPARAISFIDEIIQSIEKTLSIFPNSGKLVEDLGLDEQIRVWPYENYNSYYFVREEQLTVEILFVFNASRNIKNLIADL